MNNLRFNSTHFYAILLFALITIIYCHPVLKGGKINQSDYKQFLGMSKEIADFRDKTGKEALWTNSMFGGMPAYQISVHHPNNILVHIDKFLQLYLPRPVGIIFLYFLGFYIFMLSLKIRPDLSILGAIAFGMSSYFFIILEAGHNTKAHAIAYIAPSVASMFYCLNIKKYKSWHKLTGFFLAFLALGLHLRANHLQITYYLLFILSFFWFFYLTRAIRSKMQFDFIKKTILFCCAGIMAIAINTGNIWSTYDYSKYTIRGDSELQSENGEYRSGLDKEYATAWSYGKVETFNMLFPNFVGGSSHSKLSEQSNLFQALRKNGVSKKDSRNFIQSTPLYFGPQSFTSGPVYIGALVCLLFLMSFFVIKKPVKWVFLLLVLFSLILAWGKNFPIVTNFFLDHVPLYNKFRTVSMILIIAQFAIPVFAIMGLNHFIESNLDYSTKKKALIRSTSILGILSLFFIVFKNLLFDFSNDLDARFPDWFTQALIADRVHLFQMDVLRSVFFIIVGACILYYFTIYKTHNNKRWIFSLIALLILDMWFVNKRYLNSDDFISTNKVNQPFEAQSFDNSIKKDTTIYRVYNLNERIDQGARTSYFHHSIGGYHGAKLGKYQEMIDMHINNGNLNVLNMLNTKYIIASDQNQNPFVQINDQALGNVWFIDSIRWVKNSNEEILSLNEINPKHTVSVHAKYASDINQVTYSSNGEIKLLNYSPNRLVYSSSNPEISFAVFSEIFYPKGWKAYIDGKYVEHFSVNYILRGVILPPGDHEIIFEFKPKSFYVAAKISLFASLLLIVTALFSFARLFIHKK
ncbi:MAG: hypothetical protein CMD26_02125 [Flavobacteriales bacterium]|nr:hypothetical protein [Flavobacteriales bacterium]|tara:strand:+ start:1142 stop:3559 length:2418 start_codon:yes stop_codon:yes gene_type:complete